MLKAILYDPAGAASLYLSAVPEHLGSRRLCLCCQMISAHNAPLPEHYTRGHIDSQYAQHRLGPPLQRTAAAGTMLAAWAGLAAVGQAHLTCAGHTCDTHISPTQRHQCAGVLLWSMLTGERPFNRMSRVQVMVTICIQKKQLELPPHLPANLSVSSQDSVLAHCALLLLLYWEVHVVQQCTACRLSCADMCSSADTSGPRMLLACGPVPAASLCVPRHKLCASNLSTAYFPKGWPHHLAHSQQAVPRQVPHPAHSATGVTAQQMQTADCVHT